MNPTFARLQHCIRQGIDDHRLHYSLLRFQQSATTEDANALAAWLLTQDSAYWSHCAEALALVTDPDLQEAYFKSCTSAHRLLDADEDTPLLEVFGRWGLAEAAPLLRHYALWSEDYYEAKYAALGWAQGRYPISPEDWARIESLMALPVIPEYIPLLYSLQSEDAQKSSFERLQQLGDFISSSNLKGIVLAFGNAGAAGRPYLLHAMQRPSWEAFDAGSGPLHEVYRAIVWQRWPLETLLADLCTPEATRSHALYVWYHLLLYGVRQAAQPFQSWERLEAAAFMPHAPEIPLREWSEAAEYEVLYDLSQLAIQVKCI